MAINTGFNVTDTAEESAAKNGDVFRSYWDIQGLASGAKDYLVFEVGSNDTIIRDLLMTSVGSAVKARLLVGVVETVEGSNLTAYPINTVIQKTATTKGRIGSTLDFTNAVEIDVFIVPSGSSAGVNIATGAALGVRVPRFAASGQKFVLEVENIGNTTTEFLAKVFFQET